MKKLAILLCGVLFVMSFSFVVYANDCYEYAEEYDIAIFTYEEALALALEDLPSIQDLQDAIEDW